MWGGSTISSCTHVWMLLAVSTQKCTRGLHVLCKISSIMCNLLQDPLADQLSTIAEGAFPVKN